VYFGQNRPLVWTHLSSCRTAAEAFMVHPAKVQAYDDHLEDITEGFTELAFSGTVQKDMDGLFRRTGVQAYRMSQFSHAVISGSSCSACGRYDRMPRYYVIVSIHCAYYD
jgi:hypothetical protein